ncbi:MAG: GspH/FimT family pseudopilin [Pseudomonadota bacterium]
MIAIFAVLAVAAPGFIRVAPPSHEETLRSIRAVLVEARLVSIRGGQPVSVYFDSRHRVLGRVEGKEIVLPEGIELELLSAAELTDSQGRPQILFFADGSASGGQLTLREGDRRATLSVRWLTGVVERDEG